MIGLGFLGLTSFQSGVLAGVFIGVGLGVLILGLLTAGKIEDLHSESARQKEFSVVLIKENQKLAGEIESLWQTITLNAYATIKEKKGSDQDGICL